MIAGRVGSQLVLKKSFLPQAATVYLAKLPLGSSDHCFRVAASSPSLQQGAGLLVPADESLAPLTVFSDLAAVYQHTCDDEDSQGHDGDHHQGGDGLLLLACGHHGQEVGMLTPRTHIPRMADACWLVFLHQKPAGSMEAELTVGIWAVIKVGHHSGSHRRVTQGRRAVLQGLAHSQQETQREQGELSSRGDHLTGGGQQALQPPALPAVPEWRSGAALRGKKAPARQGQPPARAGGGRTERSLPHSPR